MLANVLQPISTDHSVPDSLPPCPGSSFYKRSWSSHSVQPRVHLLSIVLELPPAPAALVLLGRRFAVFSARSAAAFLRITVAGPPGGFGDAGRAVVEPEEAVAGEVARGADYRPC
jgi:hypothetical protein